MSVNRAPYWWSASSPIAHQHSLSAHTVLTHFCSHPPLLLTQCTPSRILPSWQGRTDHWCIILLPFALPPPSSMLVGAKNSLSFKTRIGGHIDTGNGQGEAKATLPGEGRKRLLWFMRCIMLHSGATERRKLYTGDKP